MSDICAVHEPYYDETSICWVCDKDLPCEICGNVAIETHQYHDYEPRLAEAAAAESA